MCEPATIAMVASLAATAASTVGSYQQASAEKSNARFQSQMADRNADIQEESARDASRRGAQEELRKRQQSDQFAASQRAALGATGDFTGSSARIQEDTAKLSELDAMIIRNNTEREAYNTRVAASNSRSEAQGYKAQAKGINPLFEAGTTLITGASSVAGKWDRYSKSKGKRG